MLHRHTNPFFCTITVNAVLIKEYFNLLMLILEQISPPRFNCFSLICDLFHLVCSFMVNIFAFVEFFSKSYLTISTNCVKIITLIKRINFQLSCAFEFQFAAFSILFYLALKIISLLSLSVFFLLNRYSCTKKVFQFPCILFSGRTSCLISPSK